MKNLAREQNFSVDRIELWTFRVKIFNDGHEIKTKIVTNFACSSF